MAFSDSIKDGLAANGLIKESAQVLLDATDWTQLPDSGLTSDCVALFKTYRANIRTIRKSSPTNPTWPEAPTEEWV